MTTFNKLNAGEVLSESQHYKVVKIKGDKVQLVNDLGVNVVVDKNYVESSLTSAQQVEKNEKLSRTELAALFLANPYVAMEVSFNKQVKEADVVKEIMEAYGDSTPKTMETAVKEAVKKALEGVERTIIGRHYGGTDEYGRTSFVDMNIERDASKTYDTRMRLVDTRTINYVVLRGVKYSVKK